MERPGQCRQNGRCRTARSGGCSDYPQGIFGSADRATGVLFAMSSPLRRAAGFVGGAELRCHISVPGGTRCGQPGAFRRPGWLPLLIPHSHLTTIPHQRTPRLSSKCPRLSRPAPRPNICAVPPSNDGPPRAGRTLFVSSDRHYSAGCSCVQCVSRTTSRSQASPNRIDSHPACHGCSMPPRLLNSHHDRQHRRQLSLHHRRPGVDGAGSEQHLSGPSHHGLHPRILHE